MYSPPALIVPTPLALAQVKRRLAAQGNAELVLPRGRELLRLVLVQASRWPDSPRSLVSVWFTVTLTLLVAVSPPASVIVTVKRIRTPPC